MTSNRVVVVGGGPAGLAAAVTAARAGAAVTLVDEQTEPGGQLLYRAQPIESAPDVPAERPADLRARLVADAVTAGVELQTETIVAGVFPDSELFIVNQNDGATVRAGAIVVATGSTDLPFPFAGWTSPGVFSARALQILLNRWRIRPGKRFAVVGAGEIAEEVAIDILLAGGEVVWSGIAPAPFLRAGDDRGLRGLTVGQDDLSVDVIAIAVGRQPDAALVTAAGVPLGFSAVLGGLVPLVGGQLETAQSGIFVAGDAAGIGSVTASLAEGRLAGVAAAASLGFAGADAVAAAHAAGGPELARRMAERAGLKPIHAQPYE